MNIPLKFCVQGGAGNYNDTEYEVEDSEGEE